MDQLSFDKLALKSLEELPAAAHQEHVALEILRAAYRRRRLVVGIALLTAILAAGVVMLRPARYPAEALVELQVGRASPTAAGQTSASVVVEAASIVLGEARIIRSRMVASRVVEKLDLADDAAFIGKGFLSRAIGWLSGFFVHQSPEEERAVRVAAAERALAAGLSVDADNRSYLISITFTAAQPELAARIANGVADEYLASRVETNVDAASHNMDWLTGQIANTEKQSQAAELAVATFRERTGLVDLGTQNDSLERQQLREFAAQLNAVSVARIAEEGKLARIETLAQNGAASATPELQAMPLVQAASQRQVAAARELADLQSRFGPKHPAVQQAQATLAEANAALAAETDRAVETLRANLAASRATEQDLRVRVQAMQRAAIQDTGRQAELRNLQSAADSLRERLVSLSRSRDQAQALRDLRVIPASLVVPAQPAHLPTGPGPLVTGIIGFIGGMFAGVAAAAMLERLDHGFRTSHEVAAATELRCLGLIPELPLQDPLTGTPDRPASSGTQVMFDEAVRLVVSGVDLIGANTSTGGRVVLVTSAISGEGRSTLCAGLARSLTLAGRRVLLIDGQPRRFDPSSPREPTNGHDHTDGVLQTQQMESSNSSLVVLRRNSPSALSIDVFGSPRLGSALNHARKHFDVILLEGPPIMLMADSLVLGRMADVVLLAARWAETKRRTVYTALRRMQEHGIVVDGVVLTRVEIERHAKLNLTDQGSFHLHQHQYYERAAGLHEHRPAVTDARTDGARRTVRSDFTAAESRHGTSAMGLG